jgi:hypothetical protein
MEQGSWNDGARELERWSKGACSEIPLCPMPYAPCERAPLPHMLAASLASLVLLIRLGSLENRMVAQPVGADLQPPLPATRPHQHRAVLTAADNLLPVRRHRD